METYGPYQNARSRRRVARINARDDNKALEGLRVSYRKKCAKIGELERELHLLKRLLVELKHG
jgi:hypothetical protein